MPKSGRNIRTVVAAAMISVWAACAAPPVQAASEAKVRAAFEEADNNVDGNLEVDEFVAYIVWRFAAVDKNRNGFLLPGEVANVSPEEFREADRDGDGKVSLGEAVGAKIIIFFDADTNHDGMMSLAELLAQQNSIAGSKKE